MNTLFSRVVSFHLSALALTRPPSLPLSLALTLLVVHTAALILVAQLARVPLWMVSALMLCFVIAQFVPHAREIFSPALLAPFFIAYFFAALRFVWLRVFDGAIEGYFDYTLPDARVLLQFEFLIGAAMLYSVLILFSFLVPRRGRAVSLGACVTVLVIFVWAIAEYFGHRTFGATGSDPFAYVQMGRDLATRGTASHSFPLFPLISQTELLWYPIVHVGYHLPFNLDGDAITVWSIGGSLAYALAFRLAGENALYFVNPIFSLLSVIVSGLLAWELTRNEKITLRVVTTIVVVLIIATSNEIVNWAGVTMVDTQALVFSTLAMYCALRAYRLNSSMGTCHFEPPLREISFAPNEISHSARNDKNGMWVWTIGAGLCWSIAYFVRHTQLVIAVAFMPLLLCAPFARRTRLRNFLLTGITAFLMALPDLWYHQIYLGNWLTPESEELALFSLSSIPQTLAALGQSAFIGSEFGWLSLFIILGIVFYTRREKISSIALLLWLGATLAVHLPYAALRLRDLIPQFPIFAFYASYGIVAAILFLLKQQGAWATIGAAGLIFLALELNLARVWNTLPRVLKEPPARFGAMTHAQRASFDEIARITPQNAIIGASLNSGALELYAKRHAFRPADWCRPQQCGELREFLEVTQEKNYTIYLLEDNASLANVLNELRREYQIERVTTLDVPLFGNEAVNNAGALWKITRR